MRVALFTNEYPPHVYGGAGVHVEYLARELAAADGGAHDVAVHCFGEQHEDAGPRGNLRVRAPTYERIPTTESEMSLSTITLPSPSSVCSTRERVT